MAGTNDTTDTTVDALRFATVIAGTTYPIVSAWEFDFLKEEAVIRERWNACTIYMIVQRPLTYFDNVVIDDYYINFEIADGDKPPMRCRINLSVNGIGRPEETVEIVVGFHADDEPREQPLRNVGALQIFGDDGRFLVWWSPQKILYEMLVKELIVEVAEEADPLAFLDFKVHYIGKSFSQRVWKRLTGHEKKERILVREREVGSAPEARTPHEVSLIILEVIGFDDMPMVGDLDGHPLAGSDPIVSRIDVSVDGAYEAFATNPPIRLGDAALTSEVEAMLIHRFRPAYNDVKFENYPYIKNGMRSLGYSWTGLRLERLPAFLYTDHFSMVPATRGEAREVDGGDAPDDWGPSLVEMLLEGRKPT